MSRLIATIASMQDRTFLFYNSLILFRYPPNVLPRSRKGKGEGHSISVKAAMTTGAKKGLKGSSVEAALDAPDLLVASDWDDPEEDDESDLCTSAASLSSHEREVTSALALVLRVARSAAPRPVETLPSRGVGKDPLGQASVNAEPNQSVFREAAASAAAAATSTPLWVQASRIRFREDNMRALRRLDSLGRFQLAAASVSVVLERASARVQCGKAREAAGLLAACGLAKLPQLFAVLRTFEEVDELNRATGGGSGRDRAAEADELEVRRNALKAIVADDSMSLRHTSISVRHSI